MKRTKGKPKGETERLDTNGADSLSSPASTTTASTNPSPVSSTNPSPRSSTTPSPTSSETGNLDNRKTIYIACHFIAHKQGTNMQGRKIMSQIGNLTTALEQLDFKKPDTHDENTIKEFVANIEKNITPKLIEIQAKKIHELLSKLENVEAYQADIKAASSKYGEIFEEETKSDYTTDPTQAAIERDPNITKKTISFRSTEVKGGTTGRRLAERFDTETIKKTFTNLKTAYSNKDTSHYLICSLLDIKKNREFFPIYYGTDEGQRACLQAANFFSQ